MTPTPR